MLDPATLDFLLALGEALVDAGDPVNHVPGVVREVGGVNGVPRVGVVVMADRPVRLAAPRRRACRPRCRPRLGDTSLRLDQVDGVFRLVDQARRGRLTPPTGGSALAAIRASARRSAPRCSCSGYVLFTLGLVLILRGGWLELLVGGGLGCSSGHCTWPRTGSVAATSRSCPSRPRSAAPALVLVVARVLPELAVFPRWSRRWWCSCPGALLTTAVLELSTGQVMSGSGRLAAVVPALVLLAVGILAGAQLVGVPSAAIDPGRGSRGSWRPRGSGSRSSGCGVVAVQGCATGVACAGSCSCCTSPTPVRSWAGLLFGSALSAFFGALVLAPVAMIAARQESGPPALVSFLPAFWLLVPGAVGLEGVTRVLAEDPAQGLSSLVTMGTSMIAIALGVLAGLAVSGQVADHVRLAGRRRAGDLSRTAR